MALSFNWWRQCWVIYPIFIYSGIFGYFRVFAMLCRQVRVTQVAELRYGFTQRAKETESPWHEDKTKLCGATRHRCHIQKLVTTTDIRGMIKMKPFDSCPSECATDTPVFYNGHSQPSLAMTLPAPSGKHHGTDANIRSNGQGVPHLQSLEFITFPSSRSVEPVMSQINPVHTPHSIRPPLIHFNNISSIPHMQQRDTAARIQYCHWFRRFVREVVHV
jgi:hypothetical protein